MPYAIVRAPGTERYFVINEKTGRHMSRDPLPRQRAMAQMRALYAAEARRKK